MYKLRKYQENAVDVACKSIQDKINGILVLPTGCGKSLVIANIAKAITGNVLVLQPSKEILEQNFEKLTFYGDTASIYSASCGIKEVSKITFATIGSIINKLDLFANTEVVIIDESHNVNSRGGMYKDLLNTLDVPCIGLTATPYRMKSNRFLDGSICVQAKFLTRTRPRVFKRILYVKQNSDLFKEGYLCDLRYDISNDYDSDNVPKNTTGMDFDKESLMKYNHSKNIYKKVSESIKDNYDRKHHLIFLSYVNEVTNVGVLTTGFDFPELDHIVLGRPTMSLALYYQMVGRGVRISERKRYCLVTDLCGNINKFGKVEDYEIINYDKLPRLKCNDKLLTGVNFIDGTDLEKSKRKDIEKAYRETNVIPFGKYKGTHIKKAPTDYLKWCVDNFDKGKWKDIFFNELNRRIDSNKLF